MGKYRATLADADANSVTRDAASGGGSGSACLPDRHPRVLGAKSEAAESSPGALPISQVRGRLHAEKVAQRDIRSEAPP